MGLEVERDRRCNGVHDVNWGDIGEGCYRMISKRERTGVATKWEMGWNVGLDEMREEWDGAWNGTGMELGKKQNGR